MPGAIARSDRGSAQLGGGVDDQRAGADAGDHDIAFFGAAEAFLSVHLGGSYLPLTKAEIEASSMQVKDGRDGVPGL